LTCDDVLAVELKLKAPQPRDFDKPDQVAPFNEVFVASVRSPYLINPKEKAEEQPEENLGNIWAI